MEHDLGNTAFIIPKTLTEIVILKPAFWIYLLQTVSTDTISDNSIH